MQQFQPMEFLAGAGGLNRVQNVDLFPVTDLVDCEAIIGEHFTWEKEGGASLFYPAALGSSIVAAWDFFDNSFVQHQIVGLADGRILEVNTAGIVATLGTLTAGQPIIFSEGYIDTTTKALFVWNGRNLPSYWTGSGALVGISTPLTEWTGTNHPTTGFLHGFRQVAFGAAGQPHIVALSSPDNHQAFGASAEDSSFLTMYPGEGERIMAGFSWREQAFFGKRPRGLYRLNDEDTNIANWETPKVTDAVGIPAHRAVVALENDVLFLDCDGYFHTLSQIRTDGQKEVPSLLAQELADFIRSEINLNRLDLVQATYYGRKKQVLFAVPGVGASTNTRKLLLDLNGEQPRVFFSRRDECTALTTRREGQTQEPIAGDSLGNLWRLDRAARNKNSVGYTGQYETPTKPVIDGIQFANLKELVLEMRPDGEYDLTVEVHRDGALGQTLQISMQTTGLPIGSFTLSQDALAGKVVASRPDRLEGEARHVKLLAKNSGANETFSVMKQTVRYTPGRHRSG